MAALHVMYSEDSTKRQIPSLIDATSDELLTGLKDKLFTSLDLVNVSSLFLAYLFIQNNFEAPLES